MIVVGPMFTMRPRAGGTVTPVTAVPSPSGSIPSVGILMIRMSPAVSLALTSCGDGAWFGWPRDGGGSMVTCRQPGGGGAAGESATT